MPCAPSSSGSSGTAANGSRVLDVSTVVWLDVDRFHGIEIEEFPARIAQVALWMTDHQMNLRISEEFGSYYHRLPLRTSPNIVYGSGKGDAPCLRYIPMCHLDPSWIASGSLLTIQEATLFHLGVLSSTMHTAWMRAVCGRMKSDYQYSAGIVYNNDGKLQEIVADFRSYLS